MAKFKKTEATGFAYRAINGELKLLQNGDDYITDVSLDLLSSPTNRNGWKYENLEEHLSEFVRKPILIAYPKVHGKTKIGDGHNFREKTDPQTGEKYADFTDPDAERMVGISAFDLEDVSINQRGSDTWISSKGVVYSWYAKQLTDKLKSSEQGAGMGVSIETLIEEGHVENGIEIFTKWKVLGVTILADDVRPAVADAKIATLSDREAEIDRMKLRVASYRGENRQIMETAHETKKGTSKRMAFNKVQLEALGEKFDGYRIVGCSEDGKNIALLSKTDNCFYGYTFGDETDEVITDNIKPVALNAEADFGEDVKVALDAIGAYVDEIKSLTAKANDAEARADKAEAKVAELTDKETKRRNKAVVAAIKELVKAYNADAEEPIDDKECADIVDAAEKGEFSDCDNAEGEFCGEEKACALVKAKIFDHEAAIRAKKSAAAATVHSWLDGLRKNNTENSETVESLLSRITK